MKLLLIFFTNISALLGESNQGYMKLSEITLKIKEKNKFKILSLEFFQKYRPKEIYINDTLQDIISYEYNFTYPNNYTNIFKIIWNISITTANSMFMNCQNIIEIDLSNFDKSQVSEMNNMFDCCSSLKSLNLSNFNTS